MAEKASIRTPIKVKSWQRWLLLSGLAFLLLFIPIPSAAHEPAERLIHIDASRFEYNPSVVSVNPGDLVTIELVSNDVVHGLAIDGYNLSMTADPGQTASLSFIASKQGVFRFRCTSTCGNLHPFMIGKLQVGQNLLLLRGIALFSLALVAGAWSALR